MYQEQDDHNQILYEYPESDLPIYEPYHGSYHNSRPLSVDNSQRRDHSVGLTYEMLDIDPRRISKGSSHGKQEVFEQLYHDAEYIRNKKILIRQNIERQRSDALDRSSFRKNHTPIYNFDNITSRRDGDTYHERLYNNDMAWLDRKERDIQKKRQVVENERNADDEANMTFAPNLQTSDYNRDLFRHISRYRRNDNVYEYLYNDYKDICDNNNKLADRLQNERSKNMYFAPKIDSNSTKLAEKARMQRQAQRETLNYYFDSPNSVRSGVDSLRVSELNISRSVGSTRAVAPDGTNLQRSRTWGKPRSNTPNKSRAVSSNGNSNLASTKSVQNVPSRPSPQRLDYNANNMNSYYTPPSIIESDPPKTSFSNFIKDILKQSNDIVTSQVSTDGNSTQHPIQEEIIDEGSENDPSIELHPVPDGVDEHAVIPQQGNVNNSLESSSAIEVLQSDNMNSQTQPTSIESTNSFPPSSSTLLNAEVKENGSKYSQISITPSNTEIHYDDILDLPSSRQSRSAHREPVFKRSNSAPPSIRSNSSKPSTIFDDLYEGQYNAAIAKERARESNTPIFSHNPNIGVNKFYNVEDDKEKFYQRLHDHDKLQKQHVIDLTEEVIRSERGYNENPPVVIDKAAEQALIRRLAQDELKERNQRSVSRQISNFNEYLITSQQNIPVVSQRSHDIMNHKFFIQALHEIFDLLVLSCAVSVDHQTADSYSEIDSSHLQKNRVQLSFLNSSYLIAALEVVLKCTQYEVLTKDEFVQLFTSCLKDGLLPDDIYDYLVSNIPNTAKKPTISSKNRVATSRPPSAPRSSRSQTISNISSNSSISNPPRSNRNPVSTSNPPNNRAVSRNRMNTNPTSKIQSSNQPSRQQSTITPTQTPVQRRGTPNRSTSSRVPIEDRLRAYNQFYADRKAYLSSKVSYEAEKELTFSPNIAISQNSYRSFY